MTKPEVGQTFEHQFSFSQNEVNVFAQITGDTNPVHLDAEYAGKTPFGKPIMHGFLSGSVFSKFFGTIFPGEGTIYLQQEMIFKRPMFVDHVYKATFQIMEIDFVKSTAVIQCKIEDAEGKVSLEGNAKLLNKKIFHSGQS